MKKIMMYTIISDVYLWKEDLSIKKDFVNQIIYNGLQMSVSYDEAGNKKLIQLHTTNPHAYLKYQPSQLLI